MLREAGDSMTIAGRAIGGDAPLFTVAELGLNHGGSPARAIALVEAAAAAGASAIKLQTLQATALVAASAPAPQHVAAASMLEFFRGLELDADAHRRVVARARALRLPVIATPLSLAAVDLLTELEIDAYKVASGDLTWRGLIKRCAATGKPLILSTGMADLTEIAEALVWAARAPHVALLHCVSAYPVPEGEENFAAIRTLQDMFGQPVGWSDHSVDGRGLPIAVALGASIYERHLVLTRNDDAVDAAISSTPDELRALIHSAAIAKAALGSGEKACGPTEAGNRHASRRGLCAARHLPVGHLVEADDVVALRPADGLAPRDLPLLLGRRLRREIAPGTPFLSADLAGDLSAESAVAV